MVQLMNSYYSFVPSFDEMKSSLMVTDYMVRAGKYGNHMMEG